MGGITALHHSDFYFIECTFQNLFHSVVKKKEAWWSDPWSFPGQWDIVSGSPQNKEEKGNHVNSPKVYSFDIALELLGSFLCCFQPFLTGAA